MKRKYIFWNIAASFGSQAVGIAIALIIPRLIISTYGSEVNGFVFSVMRIAAYFAVVQGGVVAAAGAHLFRAFARGQTDTVNSIFVAAHSFFKRTGAVLGLLSLLFAVLFPIQFWGTGFYVQAVLISLLLFNPIVVGYLFFFKYDLVVDSDQKSYFIINSLIVTNLIVTGIQVLLITRGAPILSVVAIVPAVGLVRLLLIRAWVVRKYPYLDLRGRPYHAALDQKWDSLALSTSRLLKFVLPSVFASLMLGFEYASVFLIYATVFNVGSSIVETLGTTLAATMGRIVAEDQRGRTAKAYEASSAVSVYGAGALSVCFLLLFEPFLALYIGGVADMSYWAPTLMLLFIFNEYLNNIRLAPNLLVRATGHLRQTRNSAIVEMAVALLLTPLGIVWLGLDGILLGSIVATFFRTVYLERYSRIALGIGGVRRYLSRGALSLITLTCVSLILSQWLPSSLSLVEWIGAAVITTTVAGGSMLVLALSFDRQVLQTLRTLFRASPSG